MKKILICIPWFDPAFRAGGPVRSIVNLIKPLEKAYELYVFCGNEDLNKERLDVVSYKWLDYSENTKVMYVGKPNIRNWFIKVQQDIQPDFIYVNGMYSMGFNLTPLIYGRNKIVLAPRGMLHEGALRQKSFKKKLYFFLWKLMGFHKKVLFHATNEQEAEMIYSFFDKYCKVHVAENFPRLFSTAYHPKKPNALNLLTVALISPMKNYHLVLNALKNITVEIHYTIAGPIKDAAYWNKCQEIIKEMPENVKVEYMGEVSPDQVEGLMRSKDVFILPSESENFGHAFVEALSAGRPVITSHFTPWNNLQTFNAGRNVNLDEQELIQAVHDYAKMDAADWDKAQYDANAYIHAQFAGNILLDKYSVIFN